MKRLLAMILCLTLLTGCASTAEGVTTTHPTAGAAPVLTAPATVPTSAPTAATEAPLLSQPGGNTLFLPFDPITVADNDRYSIVLTKGEFAEDKYCNIYATLTNKTADQTLRFQSSWTAFNGVQVGAAVYRDVEPGQTVETIFDQAYYYLDTLPFFPITDISLNFLTAPAGTLGQWEASPTVHLYPRGVENAAMYQWQPKDTDIILMDNDIATIAIIGFEPDLYTYDVFSIEFFFLNKLDKMASLTIEPLFNGAMPGISMAGTRVPAGYSVIMDMGFTNELLKEGGITRVEEQLQDIFLRVAVACTEAPSERLTQTTITLTREGDLTSFRPVE